MAGRILVVDDSALALRLIRMTLEQAGFAVTSLQDPYGLAAAISHEPPDVILLDVSLPGVSTARIVETLRRYPDSCGIPVLLHSDRDAEELAALAADTGASGYLQKTANVEELVEHLREWLDRAEGAGEE